MVTVGSSQRGEKDGQFWKLLFMTKIKSPNHYSIVSFPNSEMLIICNRVLLMESFKLEKEYGV